MNRRALLAVIGTGVSTAVAGCSSGLRNESNTDGSDSTGSERETNAGSAGKTTNDPASKTDVERVDADEIEPAIGSWSLTVTHRPNRSPDDLDAAMESTAPALDVRRLQDLFDEAVETGRGAYSTRDEDEGRTLEAIVRRVPESHEEAFCRYVIHEGEVLCVTHLWVE